MMRLRTWFAGLTFFAVACLLNHSDVHAQPTCPQGYTASGGVCVATPGATAILSRSVTLTAAQVNGMFTTPVQLIPAQGAGTLVHLITCVLNSSGTTSFTGGGPIDFSYGTFIAGGYSSTVQAALLTGTLPQIGAGSSIILAGSSAQMINKPVIIFNSTAAFAGGAGSVLNATCLYYLQSGLQ